MAHYTRITDGMSNATDGDIRGPVSDFLLQEGVLDKAGGHYNVTEKGTPDLSVDVAAGIAYVQNDSFTEFSGDNKYWETLLDASTNVSITSNSSGSTRTDLVTVKIDTGASPDANASNVATVFVVEGTPGAGAPALPASHLQIATVTVADGAIAINDANITDDRAQTSMNLALMSITSAAQGDTFYADANGLVARLGAGTAKQLLVTQGAGANPMWTNDIGDAKADTIFGNTQPFQLGSHYDDWNSETDGTTITFNLFNGQRQTVTLAGNRTVAFSNFTAGTVLILEIVQDGTGSRTLTWPSEVTWASGTAPTLTTTANAVDLLIFIKKDASTIHGFELGLDMS